MSTLWLAERAATVYGIEDAPEWYFEIEKRAQASGLKNLEIALRDSSRFPNRGLSSDAFNQEFSNIEGLPDVFDFIVVDGAARWCCVEKSLPHLKPGGYLYLDNSDADKDRAYYTSPGMSKEARRLLIEAERQGLGTIRYFRGLPPATLYATAGMLFQKTSH
jgi:predicted O-methyltransferase YrrM